MKVSVINTFVRISGFQSIQETEFKQSIIRLCKSWIFGACSRFSEIRVPVWWKIHRWTKVKPTLYRLGSVRPARYTLGWQKTCIGLATNGGEAEYCLQKKKLRKTRRIPSSRKRKFSRRKTLASGSLLRLGPEMACRHLVHQRFHLSENIIGLIRRTPTTTPAQPDKNGSLIALECNSKRKSISQPGFDFARLSIQLGTTKVKNSKPLSSPTNSSNNQFSWW